MTFQSRTSRLPPIALSFDGIVACQIVNYGLTEMSKPVIIKRSWKKPEFAEGKGAASAFGAAMNAVLTVSKPRIMQLEKKAHSKSARSK